MARIFTGFELTIKNTSNETITIKRPLSSPEVIVPGASYIDKISAPFILPNLHSIRLPPTSCVLRYFDTGVLKLQGFVHPNMVYEVCYAFNRLEPWPLEQWPGDISVYNDRMISKGMVPGTWWYDDILQQNFCISTIVVGWHGPYSGGISIITTKGNVKPVYRLEEEYEASGYLDLDAVFKPGLVEI